MTFFTPYKYIKTLPKVEPERIIIELNISIENPKLSRLVSGVFIFGGVSLLLSQIVFPSISFRAEAPLAKPVVFNDFVTHSENLETKESLVLGDLDESFAFTELQWRERNSPPTAIPTIPREFYLTITKLGIENATVETNSINPDPSKSLGHFRGSALPGEIGNTFIYGHSILPWFFNPKNYKTIFSTLPDLEERDLITISYNEKILNYIVEKKETLLPEKANPLDPISPPELKRSYLTLMTCVPPGLETNRLLVIARLVED